MSTVRFRRTPRAHAWPSLTACCIAWSPMAPLAQAQTAKAAAPAKPASAPAAAAQVPPDGGWPRAYTTNAGAALVIYQPQIASWPDQRHVVAYSAVSYAPKAATKPAFGTLKIESDTSVSLDKRLVSFSEFKITESNFSTLQKEQIRDLLTEISESMSLDERVIGLDRVLANVDASQIIPKNAEGIKADPPTVFFSKTPAILVNVDGDPIWNPIQGNDLKVRDQHELGPVRARADQDLLPARRRLVAEGDRHQGALDVRRPAARELQEAPGRRELQGGQEQGAREEALGRQDAEGLRQPDSGRDDPADRRAEVRARDGRRQPAVGQQHRRRRVPDGADRARSTTSSRAAGSRRRTSPAPGRSRRRRCRRSSSASRSNTSGRASWRRCPARSRRPRRCSSRRSRRRRASTKNDQGARGRLRRRRAAVPAGREDHRVAGGQHRQGHPQGRRPVLHVLPGRVVHVQEPDRARGRSPGRSRSRSTRFRRARRPTTSPTSPCRSRTTTR